MTFLVHSEYIYFLSVFIIATFITKLDFLENLAAILKGSKEFWRFRSKMAAASKIETKNKLELEHREISYYAKENKDSNSSPIQLKDVKQFEENVLLQLKQICKDRKVKIFENIKLLYKNRMGHVFDALLLTGSFDYIVEIKMLESKNGIQHGINQLNNFLLEYETYLEETGKHKFVGGILIVPKTAQVLDVTFDLTNIFILRYDNELNAFVNINEFENWFLNELFD